MVDLDVGGASEDPNADPGVGLSCRCAHPKAVLEACDTRARDPHVLGGALDHQGVGAVRIADLDQALAVEHRHGLGGRAAKPLDAEERSGPRAHADAIAWPDTEVGAQGHSHVGPEHVITIALR